MTLEIFDLTPIPMYNDDVRHQGYPDAVQALRERISAAPEGGAALHAVRVLRADGRIRPEHTVVVFNTGGALKYL
mgnify:CR=1 FL=1